MPYFLERQAGGCSNTDFFDRTRLDPIHWVDALLPGPGAERRCDETTGNAPLLVSTQWRVTCEDLPDPTYATRRYTITTPGGSLTMVMQYNNYTAWVAEYPIKKSADIELLTAYMPRPRCDAALVNDSAAFHGTRALIRGSIPGFSIFGQPGCWQDACCLVGTEQMIMQTYDESEWVHELLGILQDVKNLYSKAT